MVAAGSYNLFHLMSLVEIYDDLMKVGENLSKDPKNNIKSVKKWVIKFMISVLNINNKAEQRNRLGCSRLQKLFKEGIMAIQLAKAGCVKCDFFVKQEDYEVFISQIPTSETQLSSSVLDYNEIGVKFKLALGKDFEDLANVYEDDEFIEFID